MANRQRLTVRIPTIITISVTAVVALMCVFFYLMSTRTVNTLLDKEVDYIAHSNEQTAISYLENMGVLAAVLCGADEERLRRGGLERTASYGALRGRERREVLECIRFLIDRGILELTGGEYPVVRLGAENGGLPVGPLMMKTIREEERERPAATSKPAYTKLDAAQTELFGRLRTLRAELARRQGVPAFVVFSDKTLREMAALRPRSEREFRAVSGVGDRKAEQYGRAFLEEIAR